VREELGLPISIGVARLSTWRKSPGKWPSPMGSWLSTLHRTRLLHALPVELMWRAPPRGAPGRDRRADYGQLANTAGSRSERLLGRVAGQN
jgi:hypothetical protein